MKRVRQLSLCFSSEKLQEGIGFYDPEPNLKFKTVSALKKNTAIKGTKKEIILMAEYREFGDMILVAQSRNLDIQEILCYPLGPNPCALSNADGSLKNMVKTDLNIRLEKQVASVDEPRRLGQ